METKLNRSTYKQLIKKDMEFVERYFPEHSLEKKHILAVLVESIERYYPCEGKPISDESQATTYNITHINDMVCTCEMPVKVKEKNECWRCKKPFKDFLQT